MITWLPWKRRDNLRVGMSRVMHLSKDHAWMTPPEQYKARAKVLADDKVWLRLHEMHHRTNTFTPGMSHPWFEGGRW